MRTSGSPGVDAEFTWSAAEPATALGAVAVMVASPAATPVAKPAALTVATDVALLDHVNVTPAIGWFDASSAVAVKAWVPPTVVVADAGATVTLATTAGGVPASLHA